MTHVGFQIRSIGIFTGLIKKIVFLNQILHCRLNIGKFLLRKLKLVQLDSCSVKIGQKPFLLRNQKQQSLSFSSFSSTSSPYSMNVLLDILWRIKLNNPVDVGNVQPSGSNISAQQYSLIQIAKLVECVYSFLLFLISVDFQYLQIHIIQNLRVKLH